MDAYGHDHVRMCVGEVVAKSRLESYEADDDVFGYCRARYQSLLMVQEAV